MNIPNNEGRVGIRSLPELDIYIPRQSQNGNSLLAWSISDDA